MSNHAEVCPVCKGCGRYREYKSNISNSTSPTYIERTCHGCFGRGWIIVPDADVGDPAYKTEILSWDTNISKEDIYKHIPILNDMLNTLNDVNNEEED